MKLPDSVIDDIMEAISRNLSSMDIPETAGLEDYEQMLKGLQAVIRDLRSEVRGLEREIKLNRETIAKWGIR